MGLGMSVDVDETLRMVRYLLRKINGQVFFIELPGGDASHNPHMLVKAAEELGIASRAFSTLKEAFEEAKTAVDERHGLVAVTGSTKVVASYWRTVRDIKRF
jgi:folylpolyglutamate synthase/dihydropteroate synthase